MTGVGGLVSLVAGATLLGLDHRPTCDLEPAATRCPYRLRTGAAGAAFTALGAASLAASGVLFYLVYRKRPAREPRTRVGLAPLPGGVMTHATLRF
jgi:hypothetical protein